MDKAGLSTVAGVELRLRMARSWSKTFSLSISSPKVLSTSHHSIHPNFYHGLNIVKHLNIFNKKAICRRFIGHRVTDTQGYSVYGWVKFFVPDYNKLHYALCLQGDKEKLSDNFCLFGDYWNEIHYPAIKQQQQIQFEALVLLFVFTHLTEQGVSG